MSFTTIIESSASSRKRSSDRESLNAAEYIRLCFLPDFANCSADMIKVAANERPEGIVLTRRDAAQLLDARFTAAQRTILPVISAVNGARQSDFDYLRADVAAPPGPGGLRDALTVLAPTIARIRSLPASIWASEDAKTLLLARLTVRDRKAEPRRNPGLSSTVEYLDEYAMPGLVHHAETLTTLGLMRREFYDSIPACPQCASARLSVRERCSSCGSGRLTEEVVLHHLQCAYQGPEHEFRRNGRLSCPKCRKALKRFSADYDRPGMVSVCQDCGHTSGQTTVKFLCLDCEADTRADRVGEQTVYRYAVTNTGISAVHAGSLLLQPEPTTNWIVDHLRRFVAIQTDARRPFSVLVIDVYPPPAGPAARSYQRTRALFADLLHEIFTAETEIIEEERRFFVLMAGDSKTEVEAALPQIRAAIEQPMRQRLTVRYRVFGPPEATPVSA